MGYTGSKSTRVQKDLNQLMENMVLKTESVLGFSVSHLQEATLALIESDQESQIAKACLEIQIEYSTNLKMIAQALQSGITPLGLLRNLPVEYNFSLGHSDLWVNRWLGCKKDICIGTSLIPVTGNEQIVLPMTTLGIPVSNTQLLYYQLQYTDFVLIDENIVQIDLSSCLHFISKVICLPGQDKKIYHSCFHNHTSCKARIENVHTIHDIITPVESGKVCLQVMSDIEQVMALFSSCIHKENLTRGLYCIEGDIKAILMHAGRVNITSISNEKLQSLPVQFNLSQIDHFPWGIWTEEIRKDKGLLSILTEQLKEADILFKHQQGKLDEIEHEWTGMSGSSWWGRFKQSVSVWSNTSTKSTVLNVISNPIVIIFIVLLLCIIYQVFIMFRIRKLYRQVKNEAKKGNEILNGLLRRI